jgi:uncharacterized protein with NRDE domain
MCLIAFAWGASERHPFVIAANRDEYFDRPTAPLALWQTPSGLSVLGGRDLKDGGTWMGFSPHGRFAMLTNIRLPAAKPPPAAISRGSLALAWLENDLTAQAWANGLEPQRYQGFNLIIGDWPSKRCHYLSNAQFYKQKEGKDGIEYDKYAIKLIVNELPWAAVYGLSNAALDTPWPKTELLKTALSTGLAEQDVARLVERCQAALMERGKPPDDALPKTGVNIELERALSSPFVCHPESTPSYGTRTSLVAVYQPGGGLHVSEITHAIGTQAAQRAQAELDWR